MTKALLIILTAMIAYDVALHLQGYLTDRAPMWWVPWFDNRATYDAFWLAYWGAALLLIVIVLWREW